MMQRILRTDSTHKDFTELVELLDKDLQRRDGADHDFYKQYNKIDKIKYVVIFYIDNDAVGCGAIKPFNEDAMEVKRMFVSENNRGRGIAVKILKELEDWVRELGYGRTVLETGKRQPEAIRLYQKNGYEYIPNYGQYIGAENSVCMTKSLK